MIYRLQKHGFQWEDEPFDILYKRYPNCKSALSWWCSEGVKKDGPFDISRNKYLKEFMKTNPPPYKIAEKCCQDAKKNVSHRLMRKNRYDLLITGVRKYEGGIRSMSYKSCFGKGKFSDEFRPVFWYSDADKIEYEKFYQITHSKCYSEYGLRRTGCAGCPFGKNFESELKVIEKYEPLLYKAATNIFKDSYAYTRAYREFYRQKEAEHGRDAKFWFNATK